MRGQWSVGVSESSFRKALPNMPLQPTGTRLKAGAARRAGSRQRLNGGVRRLI